MTETTNPVLTDFVELATLESLADAFTAMTSLPLRFCDHPAGTSARPPGSNRSGRPPVLELPITVDDRQLGCVHVSGPVPPAARSFLTEFALTIGRLCHHTQQLQQRVDELAAMYEISSLLSGKADLREILDAATRQLVETMGLKAASLRLWDQETGELELAAVANLSAKYLAKGPVRVKTSAIDQAALSGQTVYVADMRTDPRTVYKKGARDEGLVSALVTRLASRGKPIGVLRAYMGRSHRFSPFEVSLLEAIAAQVSTAIAQARLQRDVREREHLSRQLRLAAEVQRRMIPSKPPDSARYEFGCVYQPSYEVGGDFYDFIAFDNGDIGVVVADVVGKGVPASLMMASARSALRSHARRVTDMGEIMESVNRRLFHDTLPGEFATALYVELSADGRRLKYCSAGHEPMLRLHRGRIIELSAGGLALGVDAEERYTAEQESLEPGDFLLLFTDGLIEARNYGGEAYGRARLHDSLLRHSGAAPPSPTTVIAKQLFWDVRRFVGLAPVGDDVTLVVVQVN